MHRRNYNRRQTLSLRFLDFHADPARPNHAVQVRKPQLALPVEIQRFADPHQLLAVVRAAAPDAAGPGAGEAVLGRQKKHAGLGLHHAR